MIRRKRGSKSYGSAFNPGGVPRTRAEQQALQLEQTAAPGFTTDADDPTVEWAARQVETIDWLDLEGRESFIDDDVEPDDDGLFFYERVHREVLEIFEEQSPIVAELTDGYGGFGVDVPRHVTRRLLMRPALEDRFLAFA